MVILTIIGPLESEELFSVTPIPLLMRKLRFRRFSLTCSKLVANNGQHTGFSPSLKLVPFMAVMVFTQGGPGPVGLCAHTQELHITGFKTWPLGLFSSPPGGAVCAVGQGWCSVTLAHYTSSKKVSAGRKCTGFNS